MFASNAVAKNLHSSVRGGSGFARKITTARNSAKVIQNLREFTFLRKNIYCLENKSFKIELFHVLQCEVDMSSQGNLWPTILHKLFKN